VQVNDTDGREHLGLTANPHHTVFADRGGRWVTEDSVACVREKLLSFDGSDAED